MKTDFFTDGEKNPGQPLADRLRPESLDRVVGQQHLLDPGSVFRSALDKDALGSIVLWGPPGSGKTTIALLISNYTGENFVRFSAVTGGVALVRKIISEARKHLEIGTGTLLFVDEIHRFNRAQQDAFLPHVENGTIRLVGATTENPSFEINAPLLSRCTVYVLNRLEKKDLLNLLERAVKECSNDSGKTIHADSKALEMIAEMSDGDGRRCLNILEFLIKTVENGNITASDTADLLDSMPLLYDKSGEEHFNLISALHKSLRSGDVDASLYWLARMIESGENPLYIARRMIRFATEDIGLADPSALTVAMRAADSYRFLGSPEGELALAEAACYLALAPKSNSVYTAWKKARKTVRERGSIPVPAHLRNAPTNLMKKLGYGKGYQYAHAMPGKIVTHSNLPEEIEKEIFYTPGNTGREILLEQKLTEWKKVRETMRKRRKIRKDEPDSRSKNN